jgi:hypothetical protein
MGKLAFKPSQRTGVLVRSGENRRSGRSFQGGRLHPDR